MKLIIQISYVLCFLCLPRTVSFVFSQSVGIGSNSFIPDGSAVLEVLSTSKGILIPRVSLTASNEAGPINSPQSSLLVYNIAAAGTFPNNVTPGYYYNSGTNVSPNWVRLLGSGSFANPASSIGLSAYNGSATTAMRSDATPALSQAISPVWTGTHNFNRTANFNNSTYSALFLGGPVGIGTSTPLPTILLDVQSSGTLPAYIRTKSTGAGDAGIFIDKRNLGSINYIGLQTNGNDKWWICTINDNNFRIKNAQTGGSVVMTIDSLEKVGIGDNPNPNKLFVEQSGNVIAGTGFADNTNNAVMGYGFDAAYCFGVTGFTTGTNNYSGGVHGAISTETWGALGYRDSNSNSFGGYFSGDAYISGKVGIGTDTPSQKLDISGNTNISGSAFIGGNAGIGTNTPNSKLEVSGSISSPISINTTSYSLNANDYTVIFNGTGLAATLPNATGCSGRIYIIVNQGSTSLTVSSYQNLLDNPVTAIPNNSSITIQSNGLKWYQIK